MRYAPVFALLVATLVAAWATCGQGIDAGRLRENACAGTLTAHEQAELNQAMGARGGGTVGAAQTAEERRADYLRRQMQSLALMRERGDAALRASEARAAPTGPGRVFYVNNQIGDDAANGLSATPDADGAPVRSLARAVSMLRPGDTLHLAVTDSPYRETLTLGDDFGGTRGHPIVIDGHGATILGCDPLRLDGWEPAGEPGLYRSARFMSELEEFGDGAKLGRVFFVFDGVVQHMGRSMKGAQVRFKSPADLQPGEWTYVEVEKSFYLKVAGTLADAHVEAPYRRNGVAIRAPQVALSHVVIRNLIVCRVLNDGFNLHGTTRDLLLQNIASVECGDDGISPHETCEVTIDGYWGVGNATGMGNGHLSITDARNLRLEGNRAHQLMIGHAAVTAIRNSVIAADAGTQPINITNSQGSRLTLDNVQISSPAGCAVLVGPDATVEGRRLTSVGPDWRNAGAVHLSECVLLGGHVTSLDGGTWEGSGNVYDVGMMPPAGEVDPLVRTLSADLLQLTRAPFPEAGADPSHFAIPPRPFPHPAAGTSCSTGS